MKHFGIVAANPNASRSIKCKGMRAACDAFNLAITAATPREPRDDSRAITHLVKTMQVGESYIAKPGPYAKDVHYMIGVFRTR